MIHYGFNKVRRVARSVMGAEVQYLLLRFSFAFLVQELAEEITGRRLLLEAMIYSKSVFDVVAKTAKLWSYFAKLMYSIYGRAMIPGSCFR